MPEGEKGAFTGRVSGKMGLEMEDGAGRDGEKCAGGGVGAQVSPVFRTVGEGEKMATDRDKHGQEFQKIRGWQSESDFEITAPFPPMAKAGLAAGLRE
jgi:hypothetical protein